MSLYGILNYRTGSNHQTQYSKTAYEHHDHLTILFSIYEELWYPASNEIVAGRVTPLQGPKPGSCVTLRNELSEETYVLTKHEILLGKGTRVENRRVGEPGELLCRVARSLGFYGDGISFQVVFGQSF